MSSVGSTQPLHNSTCQEAAQLSLFDTLESTQKALRCESHAEKRPNAYVNHLQCVLIKDHLKLASQWSTSGSKFALKDEPRIEQIRALIFVVSICDRLNWDFVLGPLAQKLSEITKQFEPHYVQTLTRADFRTAFGNYRRDDGRIRFRQKLRTLHAVAQHILNDDIVSKLAHTTSVQGPTGALAIILQLAAFSDDPVRKKCNALLHEIVRRKLIAFSDNETIDPAVDYHIMRLYLRTGRVEIRDRNLSDRLVNRRGVRIERITEIRTMVAEAMRYTAWINGMTLSTLNDLEWLFARKACRRNGVWCFGEQSCPLESVCPSANRNPKSMITEPDSRHGYY